MGLPERAIGQLIDAHGDAYLIKAICDIHINKTQSKTYQVLVGGRFFGSTADVISALNEYIKHMFSVSANIINKISWESLIKIGGEVPSYFDSLIKVIDKLLNPSAENVEVLLRAFFAGVSKVWEFIESLIFTKEADVNLSKKDVDDLRVPVEQTYTLSSTLAYYGSKVVGILKSLFQGMGEIVVYLVKLYINTTNMLTEAGTLLYKTMYEGPDYNLKKMIMKGTIYTFYMGQKIFGLGQAGLKRAASIMPVFAIEIFKEFIEVNERIKERDNKITGYLLRGVFGLFAPIKWLLSRMTETKIISWISSLLKQCIEKIKSCAVSFISKMFHELSTIFSDFAGETFNKLDKFLPKKDTKFDSLVEEFEKLKNQNPNMNPKLVEKASKIQMEMDGIKEYCKDFEEEQLNNILFRGGDAKAFFGNAWLGAELATQSFFVKGIEEDKKYQDDLHKYNSYEYGPEYRGMFMILGELKSDLKDVVENAKNTLIGGRTTKELIAEYDKYSIVALQDELARRWTEKEFLEQERDRLMTDVDVKKALNNIDIIEARSIINAGGRDSISEEQLEIIRNKSNESKDLVMIEIGESTQKHIFSDLKEIDKRIPIIQKMVERKVLVLRQQASWVMALFAFVGIAYIVYRIYKGYQLWHKGNIRTTLADFQLKARFDPLLNDRIRQFSENRPQDYNENDSNIFDDFRTFCDKIANDSQLYYEEKTLDCSNPARCTFVQGYARPIEELDKDVMTLVNSVETMKSFLADKEITDKQSAFYGILSFLWATDPTDKPLAVMTEKEKQELLERNKNKYGYKEKISDVAKFFDNALHVKILTEEINIDELLFRRNKLKNVKYVGDEGEQLFRAHVFVILKAHFAMYAKLLEDAQISNMLQWQESGIVRAFSETLGWIGRSTGFISVKTGDVTDINRVMEMSQSGSTVWVSQWGAIVKTYLNIGLVVYKMIVHVFSEIVIAIVAWIMSWFQEAEKGNAGYAYRISGMAIGMFVLYVGSIVTELLTMANAVFEARIGPLTTIVTVASYFTPFYYYYGAQRTVVAGSKWLYKKATGEDHPVEKKEKDKEELAKKKEEAQELGKLETRILCSVCKTDLATLKEHSRPKNVYCSQGCGFLAAQIKT